MRRSRRTIGRTLTSALVGLGLLAALAGCSSGDAEDADAIVSDSSDDSTSAESTTDDSVTEAGTGTTAADQVPISVFDLEVGICFDDPAFAADSSSTIGETVAVQCFEPHDAEVYAVIAFTQTEDDDFPGEDAVQEYADDQCFDRFEAFVGIPYEESALDIATIWPTEDSWAQGDRQAVCSVFHVENQKLEGTMDSAEL